MAAFVAAQYLPGFEIDDIQTLFIVIILVALINAIMSPLITWLTFPFTILTISLILFAMNICVIKLADGFIDGFTVNGWMPAILFSLVITLVSIGTDKLLLRRSF
jgi:putative membrane protein